MEKKCIYLIRSQRIVWRYQGCNQKPQLEILYVFQWKDIQFLSLVEDPPSSISTYERTYLFVMGYMFYLCYLYLFAYTGIRHDSPISWCLCCVSVRRQVKQELLTRTEHLSSSLVLMGVRVARSLVFGVMSCWSLFVLFYLVIVLLSILRVAASDYTFSIFKLSVDF